MDATRRLLQQGERSSIAGVARGGLIGLHAMLADAVLRFPQDAGVSLAAEVIRQLDELLAVGDGPAAGGESLPGQPRPPAPAVTAPAEPETGLGDLVAEFAADPAVAESIDEQSLTSLGSTLGEDDSWRLLHLCLLRLPAVTAERWRVQAAGRIDPGRADWRVLPGERETVLVPPRVAAGYRIAPGAPADDEVLDALGLRPDAAGAAPEAAELSRLSSLLLELAGIDENLMLALESALFQGVRRLDTELRQRYRTDLLGRLREYGRSTPGSVRRLEALLDIDEAANSLTHRPPPSSDSWWGRVHRQSRRMVDRSADDLKKAGVDVEVLPISLRYREVRDLTGGNDVASRSGGEPGDVLACLRLWARVGGRTLPGRVMYRA
jgi:hypothetical protein